jgi:hypothetical protein
MIQGMGEAPHCVCGCGRTVPRRAEQANLLAIRLIPELMLWDRHRLDLRRGEVPPSSPVTAEKLDAFLATGGEHYRTAVDTIHAGAISGLGFGFEVNNWLRYSRRSRRKLHKLAPDAIVGDRTPMIGEAELAQLDREHPERSYTGAARRAEEA